MQLYQILTNYSFKRWEREKRDKTCDIITQDMEFEERIFQSYKEDMEKYLSLVGDDQSEKRKEKKKGSLLSRTPGEEIPILLGLAQGWHNLFIKRL